MNIFYEESGQFKVATIVQKNDTTYQVDTLGGKRAKIKANHVFFEFDADGNEFLQQAQSMSAEMDTDLLWSVCDEQEWSAVDLANEYFGHQPSLLEQAATLMAVYAAPMYFYKKNKGIFKAAPEETLKQALAAIERKKAQEEQINQWIEELSAFRLPENIQKDLPSILHRPDKQSLTYKAFTKACDMLKLSPLALARQIGGVTSTAQYLYDGFVINYFPKGIDFPDIAVHIPDLPKAENIQAFSIDDASTTEIDDAISVTHQAGGKTQVGIHIAIPAIALNDAIAAVIQQRQSTVYFPTGKITMLPENWIQSFSLDEGDYRPCMSIYFEVDDDGSYRLSSQRIEQVMIQNNLRIQNIEPYFNRQTGTESDEEQFAHHHDMRWLYRFAIQLQKQRERYLEDAPVRYEYMIEVSDDEQTVAIRLRERDAPIDTVVSEMMILANSSWAKFLHENQSLAIYRGQSAVGKVRMSTQAEKHEGMNVEHYAWLTSPLRRAVDFINQRQLISLLDHQYTPFFPTDEKNQMYAALRDFDLAHTAYNEFQQSMERYWSVVFIQQQKITELPAVFLKGDLVRLEGVPMTSRASGIPIDLLPKTKIRVQIKESQADESYVHLAYLGVVAP